MGTTETTQEAASGRWPSWVIDALDDNARRKLILSWRQVPGRGLVVIGADMAETVLATEDAARAVWRARKRAA